MKTSFILMLGAAVLLLAGCGTPTKVASGSVAASTFSFVVPPPKGQFDPPDRLAPVHAMIQDSITRNLASKGVTRSASGGDVTVAYLIIVGNDVSTQAINTYFGDSRDFSKLQDKAQTAYTSSRNRNYFEAGTLLVDILDGKTWKLLKRSYVVRPLLRNPSPEARAEHIQEAVDAVLADLKITR